jgi:hypothetical protein
MHKKNQLKNKTGVLVIASKTIGVLLTLLFNCLMTYYLMWMPYSLYIERPEFSHIPFKLRETYSFIASIITFLILLALSIVMIYKLRKKEKFFFWAPLLSVLAFFLTHSMSKFYPDSTFEYTNNGYRYLEEKWYLDGKKTYKRFKSEKRFEEYSDSRSVVWTLDSSQGD